MRTRRTHFRSYIVAGTLISTVLLLLTVAPPAASESTRDQQWYLDSMQAEKLWEQSEGDDITVAVIDSGVDTSLPELRGQVLPGRNFVDPDTGAHTDALGHGTSMAALIAGTGTSGGFQGLAPGVKILPVTVFEGRDTMSTGRVLVKALDYSVKSGAEIINMSFGGTSESITPEVQAAIDRAHKAGVLLFAGSGNDGQQGNKRRYPAAAPGVVGVAATTKEKDTAPFSSYGQHVTLAAPGDEMPKRCPQNKGNCLGDGGTSAASAITSAAAALIWSKNPDWTNNQVLRAMIETAGRPKADEGKPPSVYVGYGQVRPRMVLLEGEGDPGDPDKSPIFSKYYAKQDAKAASKSPSPEGSSPGDPAQDQDSAEEPQRPQADAASSSGGNSTLLVGGLGTAAVLVLGASALLLIRRRNQTPR